MENASAVSLFKKPFFFFFWRGGQVFLGGRESPPLKQPPGNPENMVHLNRTGCYHDKLENGPSNVGHSSWDLVHSSALSATILLKA